MSRIGPRLKIVRRLDAALPGLTPKDAGRRPYPPGEHGNGARGGRRKTEYRERLEEKQKVRFNYGLKEKKLRRYFERARDAKGPTGAVLLELLERRLDNVVFRLGFARTVPAARQYVVHGHIRVNGENVDRPGFEVESGDEISVAEKMQGNPHVKESVDDGPRVRLPSNLDLDPDDPFVGRIAGDFDREDVPILVDESSIVEFYAR